MAGDGVSICSEGSLSDIRKRGGGGGGQRWATGGERFADDM